MTIPHAIDAIASYLLLHLLVFDIRNVILRYWC